VSVVEVSDETDCVLATLVVIGVSVLERSVWLELSVVVVLETSVEDNVEDVALESDVVVSETAVVVIGTVVESEADVMVFEPAVVVIDTDVLSIESVEEELDDVTVSGTEVVVSTSDVMDVVLDVLLDVLSEVLMDVTLSVLVVDCVSKVVLEVDPVVDDDISVLRVVNEVLVSVADVDADPEFDVGEEPSGVFVVVEAESVKLEDVIDISVEVDESCVLLESVFEVRVIESFELTEVLVVELVAVSLVDTLSTLLGFIEVLGDVVDESTLDVEDKAVVTSLVLDIVVSVAEDEVVELSLVVLRVDEVEVSPVASELAELDVVDVIVIDAWYTVDGNVDV